MAAAPHIEALLRRIDAEMAREHAAAKRFHVFDGAARYAGDPFVRERTLRRLGIADGTAAAVVAQTKARLVTDRDLRLHRPLWARPRIHRWALFAVWLGERRLRRSGAMQPSSHFQLAAK